MSATVLAILVGFPSLALLATLAFFAWDESHRNFDFEASGKRLDEHLRKLIEAMNERKR